MKEIAFLTKIWAAIYLESQLKVFIRIRSGITKTNYILFIILQDMNETPTNVIARSRTSAFLFKSIIE